ncbi:MAG: hypothetical protein GTN62_05810 [Gemmatimonadales bacterium]|nr:hypothetical protein [Gemmatimonadales bacterium]NIN11015.1 hypothetical protein [Gemmatimonadales bacterium]NIN49612.1 hypothetical protein [Gemmatimonadales bacterium]NIP07076.1 hypothetical protein [Gemmatimonadales bacterium]NIQ99467.1 hypothetical protein [Gemmatimonadales bacterium]
MQAFNSGLFWFVEGVLFCVMVMGLRAWAQDRGIPTPWWKWVAFLIWILLAGFAIGFVGTSWGEGETTAAIRGGMLFGFVAVASGVALWHVWMIGAKSPGHGSGVES